MMIAEYFYFSCIEIVAHPGQNAAEPEGAGKGPPYRGATSGGIVR